jgi:hypothetical protein
MGRAIEKKKAWRRQGILKKSCQEKWPNNYQGFMGKVIKKKALTITRYSYEEP